MQITRTCKTCGKTYQTMPSKNKTFCSRECFKNRLNGLTRPCVVCGKPIKCYSSTYNKKIYCSEECRKSVTHIVINCKLCGKEYEVAKSRYYKHGIRHHYCSKKCYDLSIKNRNTEKDNKHTHICTCCGNTFIAVRNNKTSNTFCSQKCSIEYQRGANHHSYVHGKKAGLRKRGVYAKRVFDTTNLDNEVWVPIPGFEKFYQVSNFGRIKSLARTERTRNRYSEFDRTKQERILTYGNNIKNRRYNMVELYNGSGYVKDSAHRLVYNAFRGPIPDGHIIHHIDENKLNNKLDNLKCVDFTEHNNIHVHVPWNKGMKFPYKKRKSSQYDTRRKKIVCIETGKTYDSVGEAAKAINRAINTISTALTDKTKTAGGYHFEYRK